MSWFVPSVSGDTSQSRIDLNLLKYLSLVSIVFKKKNSFIRSVCTLFACDRVLLFSVLIFVFYRNSRAQAQIQGSYTAPFRTTPRCQSLPPPNSFRKCLSFLLSRLKKRSVTPSARVSEIHSKSLCEACSVSVCLCFALPMVGVFCMYIRRVCFFPLPKC